MATPRVGLGLTRSSWRVFSREAQELECSEGSSEGCRQRREGDGLAGGRRDPSWRRACLRGTRSGIQASCPSVPSNPGLGPRFPKSGPGPGSEAKSVPKDRFHGPMNLGKAVHSPPVWGSWCLLAD